jgi:hypothetical protein
MTNGDMAGLLRVGDAYVALDPLSSSGVQAAIQSALPPWPAPLFFDHNRTLKVIPTPNLGSVGGWVDRPSSGVQAAIQSALPPWPAPLFFDHNRTLKVIPTPNFGSVGGWVDRPFRSIRQPRNQ